jgi:hypothetical protein
MQTFGVNADRGELGSVRHCGCAETFAVGNAAYHASRPDRSSTVSDRDRHRWPVVEVNKCCPGTCSANRELAAATLDRPLYLGRFLWEQSWRLSAAVADFDDCDRAG